MVKGIARSKNDLLGLPLFGFIFGNQRFLLALRIMVAALFVYAVIFGFLSPDKKENFFTTGLFWGLFWPFFMLVTLPTFGAIFCSICPHGFLGSYISKVGLNKKMPKALQNRYIGFGLLLLLYWCAFYIYEPLYKSPLSVAIFFLVFTILAVVIFFLFENMAYCKYMCPIGSVKNALSRVGFVWLNTNKEHCNSCKEFTCAKDCHYGLSPFNFEKNSSMQDCTLCMACTKNCDAVSLEVRKPSFSLYGAIKKSETIDIWVYILLFAVISLTMRFHHALGRSAIADSLPWYAQAAAISQAFPSIEIPLGGVLALIYAVIFTLIFSLGGFYMSSKILKISYKESFINFGYALAPLMVIGSLSHVGSFFFTSYYHGMVNGFIQAFALPLEYVKPLAKHSESWLGIFKIFTYLAILWSLALMVKRFKLIEADLKTKMLAFPFASGMIALAIVSEIAVGLIFRYMASGGIGTDMELKNRIFEIFMIGGDFVLYLLITMSILSVAIFIERCVVLWRIKSNLKEMNKNSIMFLAQKRLPILATFGNNAPFIGLFGTVIGVIKAFHELSLGDGFGIKVVMGGISESLVATAMGLLVAIPAVIAYNYFITRLKTMLLEKEIHETA